MSEDDEIDIKELPGVGPATAEKLEKGGFNSVLSIAVSSIGQLTDAGGVSEAVARKMVNAAREKLDMGFQSGTDMLENRKDVKKISTGSSNFDEMLGGGFETGSIIECFGKYGSGKTQVGHSITVNALNQTEEAKVVYIDTENTFRPERVKNFCDGLDMDPEKALNRIKVAKAFNSDHQMLLAEKVEDLVEEDEIILVIVDSLTSHFRAEYVGRGTLAERQQKLNKHMRTLALLADKFNICVYVTNQVMAKPDQFFGDPTEAIGGNIVGHNSTFRIYLRRGKKNTRVAKLIDSPNRPDSESVFKIGTYELQDA